MSSIGIDLGGTSAKLGLIENNILTFSMRVPTRQDSDYGGILSDLIAGTEKLIAMAGEKGSRIEKIGIGSPGLVDAAAGMVCTSNNIRWSDAPLRDDLQRAFSLPVKIANDAKCATLGEAVCGAGQGFKRVAMMTLGTGVGGGFVFSGRLETGTVHADAAGIFGHMTLVPGGRRCNCGRRGCLEAYCSATALGKTARRILGKSSDAKALFEAAGNGHSQAAAAVAQFAERLGSAVASLANILRPDVFIIGGGVSASANLFLPQVNTLLEREVFGFHYAPLRAIPAALGNDAGMIGAALLS